VLCVGAATAVSLLGFARHKGVNLSALGIGIDFLQVRMCAGMRPPAEAGTARACPTPHPSLAARGRGSLTIGNRCGVVGDRVGRLNSCVHVFAPPPSPAPMLTRGVHAPCHPLHLQVVSVFSSFGFKWPVQLTKLFAASSMSSFNDQLMAPECSVGSWSFELKCVVGRRVLGDRECRKPRVNGEGTWSFRVEIVGGVTLLCMRQPSSPQPLWTPPLFPLRCVTRCCGVRHCVGGCRWYMMQAVPLVFILGLVIFAVVGAARVRIPLLPPPLSRCHPLPTPGPPHPAHSCRALLYIE
jgi:hypothetical protein